jgi:uncharacterized protein
MFFKDNLTITDSKRVITDEGYLLVPSNIGKADHVQNYLASEIGLTDRDPLDVVKVFRPKEEVFKADSIQSFNLVPITNDHPNKLVDAKSYKSVNCGVATDIKAIDNYLTAQLHIKDEKAIEDIKSGKVELSNGYTCDLDMTSGVTASGLKYDCKQINIKGNHVAIVKKGRAGSDCKISDSNNILTNGKIMKIILNDVSYECNEQLKEAFLADKAKDAKKYEDMKAKKEAKEKDLEDNLEKEKEEKENLKKDNEEKKAKMDAMNEKLSVKALDSAIEERLSVIDSAKKLVNDFDYKCKSVEEIKKEVVASKIDVADKSVEYINARFDIMVEDHKPASAISNGLSNISVGDSQTKSLREQSLEKFKNGGK